MKPFPQHCPGTSLLQKLEDQPKKLTTVQPKSRSGFCHKMRCYQ